MIMSSPTKAKIIFFYLEPFYRCCRQDVIIRGGRCASLDSFQPHVLQLSASRDKWYTTFTLKRNSIQVLYHGLTVAQAYIYFLLSCPTLLEYVQIRSVWRLLSWMRAFFEVVLLGGKARLPFSNVWHQQRAYAQSSELSL